MIETPAYIFDKDVFNERIRRIKEALAGIPLTFSIKANPFLLADISSEIQHVEVCSPGELSICKNYEIPGERIIYSGVNKELCDIREAMEYGADIVTAESVRHVELEEQVAETIGIRQSVILRLTSGNQFGMSEETVLSILKKQANYPNLEFMGIHFYSGTQKKTRQIKGDISIISNFLEKAKNECGWTPKLLEYGPGLAVDYFNPPYDETDFELLKESSCLILELAQKYPVAIEMGRFLASSCGTYYTSVMDIKNNDDVNYVICDGGIHQIKYHGQTMAMQVPPIEVFRNGKMVSKVDGEDEDYCLCGSLCTVADVLIREVSLPKLMVGDVLAFGLTGAYSMTEGSLLFLSRKMPKVFIKDGDRELRLLRDFVESFLINSRI